MHVRNEKCYRARVDCPEGRFKDLYRFTEDNVEWMAEHFLGPNTETRGKALSPKQKMMVFLRFVGDPGFHDGIAEDIGIHRSTVSKTIPFVLQQIVEKSNEWIVFPVGGKIEDAKREWGERYQFPTAFGAIDCTHVPIKKPSLHGDDYVNRKGFCSINVQCTCNAKELFTSIDAQWPGSVHDSRILRNSTIFQLMETTPDNAILLGDIGYGISRWMMTPYDNPGTQEELAYNRLHSKERVIIERCFGQMKKRFAILQQPIRVDIAKVPSIIVACATLHNVAKYLQDYIPWEDIAIENDNVDNIHEILPDREVDRRRNGQRKREEIKNIISNM